MYLGIDIGSSSSKAVILSPRREIVTAQVVNLGTGTRGASQVLELAYAAAGVQPEAIRRTVATGYGRMTFSGADKQITEISCHAKGARFLLPGLRTIIDVGGQDTKAIRLSPTGLVDNFVMNDKCAAGTGRFLEVMSRVLGCTLEELSPLAAAGQDPVSISNLCTVFAESEVISHLAAGVPLEDVAAGAIRSVALRVGGMAQRVGVEPELGMSGGGALNAALVEAIGEAVGCPVRPLPQPQTIGALGAALFAWEMDGGE